MLRQDRCGHGVVRQVLLFAGIACQVDERSFRLAVIVGVVFFEEHAGITGNECPKGG